MAFRNWKQEMEDRRPIRPIPWAFLRRVALVGGVMAGATCGALWVWPGYLRPRPWVRPGPPPPTVAILFTADLGGYLEACGDAAQRRGGLARLSGYLSGVQAPKTRLIVDAGDMTSGTRLWQRMAAACCLEALGKMNFIAANLGAAEIALSAEQLRQLAAGSPVPLVSANVRDAATGAPLVASHRQVLIDNLRVAVVGVVQPDAARPVGEGVRVADVDESLGELLVSLRERTDLIVLLASADEARMRRIAQAHPEVDVILGGRVRQASAEIQKVGSARIAYHADKGQMLGRMEIEIGPNARPGAAVGTIVVLDDGVPEDPAMLTLIDRHNGELARLKREGGLAALGVATTPPPAGSNRYVGSQTCQSCHRAAYQVWRDSRHSRALASLTRCRRDGNPDCLRCHVTDLGAGDGFLGVELSPQRADVQCESCHGRSGDHVRARRQGAPAGVARHAGVLPKSCQSCHDCQHSRQFTYQPYWENIEHGKEPQSDK